MNLKMSAAMILTAASVALGGTGGPIAREGDGPRRETLNAMEAKAFPAEALAGFDGAQGVTVFLTVSQESRESLKDLRRFDRLQERLGSKGLSVVGVVDESSWEAISARKQAGLILAELMLDEGGAFREVLLCDEDPDIYIVDRAGQLRYADVTAESAAGVVNDLLKETVSDAEGELARREAVIASGIDPYLAAKPVTLEDIPASAYADANWPKHNTSGMSALDRQGKKLPKPLGKETWISKKDRKPEGHVLVLDFWATWCGPCIRAQPKLVKLQKKFNDDLMILAIGGSGEDINKVKGFLAKHPKPYYNLFDGKQTVSNSLKVQAIPHTVVISTDGIIRWQGNPLSSNFEQIVAQVIAADPYIEAKKNQGESSASARQSDAAGKSSGSQSAYAAQKWPATNTGNLYAKNMQGEKIEGLLEGVEWLDGEAANTENKVTIVDFWATWCGPCLKFSPKLDAVQRRFKDDVVAIGFSGQNDAKSKVQAHIEEHPVSYRHVYAEGQDLYRKVGVSGIPHVLVLSSDGVVRWQGFPSGGVDFQGIVAKIVMADRKARKALAD